MEASRPRKRLRELSVALLVVAVGLLACAMLGSPPPPDDPVVRGERIFFEETFEGNGRTCGTCHRAEANFGLDPVFIAGLPDDDPLFVAEFDPNLAENFEKPRLMREFGLILENLDGFGDLESRFVLRGVPHVLAQRTSVESTDGPRTGWSGDGSPGDGSLRSFSVGAVIQHFPKTTGRVAGVDFRLPTDEELDALEAFMLSLGRQQDLELPLALRGTVPARGQEIFLDDTLGKCNICHVNAGANAVLGGQPVGNANFDTGVEDLPDQPADLTGELVPPDDGFGIPGDETFNTPPLVEAADTGPFFHNNAIETLEAAVAFYSGEAFNASASGQTLADLDPEGVGIRLDATQTTAVAAFLRVLNALENIRAATQLLEDSAELRLRDRRRAKTLLARAVEETEDAAIVLRAGGLHPDGITSLERAVGIERRALRAFFGRSRRIRQAIDELERARSAMLAKSTAPA